MLMNKVKPLEAVLPHMQGKVFIVNCFGCKEVSLHSAEGDIQDLICQISEHTTITGTLTADYICNPEYQNARFHQYEAEIAQADTILVFSCGVGVQTVAEYFPHKRVCPGCDSYALPGFQGVTPLEYDCKQCGQCYLNLTGGICPITACSKSLINGQCGGAKNGKCEVDPNMECGWERIQRRLTQLGRLDVLKCPVQLRNYAADQEVSE